jgi:predicted methyltransferase
MMPIKFYNTLSLCIVAAALLICPEPGRTQPIDSVELQRSISGPDREIADRMRDSARKPVEVLQFLGLQSGMAVLDVYAAGGYYTFILSRAVGPQGIVYAQNSPRALRYEEDRTDITQGDALTQKIAAGKLDNVIRVDRAISETNLPANSIDFVLVSQILHDYYNRSPASAHSLLTEVFRIMKPGAVLGIIDHTGTAENDNNRLHRMQKAQAYDALQRAGFVVEAESELLANSNDNPRRSIFDPLLNRGTDQFLLRAVKPIN